MVFLPWKKPRIIPIMEKTNIVGASTLKGMAALGHFIKPASWLENTSSKNDAANPNDEETSMPTLNSLLEFMNCPLLSRSATSFDMATGML